MRLRIVLREDDRLGANAAASFQHLAPGGVDCIMMQQLGQRLRLVVQPLTARVQSNRGRNHS